MKNLIYKNFLIFGLLISLAVIVGIKYVSGNVPEFMDNIAIYIASFKPSSVYLVASLPLLQVSSVSKIRLKLEPSFVSGFTDAEGSFIVLIIKNTGCKTGYYVQAAFQISLHEKDIGLLYSIRDTLGGVGKVYDRGKNASMYRVYTVKELIKVIDYFDKYPLLTKKRADFELFKSVVNMMYSKEHLTIEGLKKIVAIKASINKGLSDELKGSFSDIIPAPRPEVQTTGVIDPHWLAGFVSGEGSFYVNIRKSLSLKAGAQVSLRFTITQHARDYDLMQSLIAFFGGCGKIERDYRFSAINFVVHRFSEINTVCTFFKKYQIEGVKKEDFVDFCKVAEIMKDGGHLTPKGLEDIRIIKAGMNSLR